MWSLEVDASWKSLNRDAWSRTGPASAGPDSQAPHGPLAEEVHHVGCIESSRPLPRPSGGMPPPHGNWLLRRNSKPLSADGRAKFVTTGGHHARSTENNSRTAHRGCRGLRNRKPARGHLRNPGGRAGGFAVGRISHRTRTLRSLATSQALGRGVDSVASCAQLAALHCRTLGVFTGLRLVLGAR